jgi:hypothetical protein
MKTWLFAAMVLALMASGNALAQAHPQTASPTAEASIVRWAPKTLMVSGKASVDGRTLLTDIDTEWSISNAEALKGREGTLVTVKCYVDTERSQIRVLSVKSAQPDSKYAARAGDSAFRR